MNKSPLSEVSDVLSTYLNTFNGFDKDTIKTMLLIEDTFPFVGISFLFPLINDFFIEVKNE